MTNKESIEILNKWYLNATNGMTKERLGYIEGWFNEKDKKAFELAIKTLEERPQGEWKFDGWGTYCSECGYRPKLGGGKFCSECGADMRGCRQ